MRRLLIFTNYAAQLMALIDIGKAHIARPPHTNGIITKKETQPTDFSAIASPLSDPYRIQNIKFYEI